MPYTPTITVETTPGIEITMAGGMTYEECVAGLGYYVYSVIALYLSSNSNEQLIQEMLYQIKTAEGRLYEDSRSVAVDPYQRQNSFLFDFGDQCLLLNNLSQIDLTLVPGGTLNMQFYAYQASYDQCLDMISVPNKERIQSLLDNLKLFQEAINRKFKGDFSSRDYFKMIKR